METHMTRTEYRQLLTEMANHADAMDNIAKKLLDLVTIDRRFIKTYKGSYQMDEGQPVPKWEVIANTCIWGDTRTLCDAIHRLIDNQKDEVDEFEEKK